MQKTTLFKAVTLRDITTENKISSDKGFSSKRRKVKSKEGKGKRGNFTKYIYPQNFSLVT